MQQENFVSVFTSFLLGIVLCFLLLRHCTPSKPAEIVIETIHDTLIEIDTFVIDRPPVKWKPPVAGPIQEIAVVNTDTNACDFNRVYVDSLITDDISIYYRDSVNGYLLSMEITYDLKNDTIITNTITITDSIAYVVEVPIKGFYVTGGLGISSDGIKTVLIGLDYNTKKQIGFGYQFDISRSTHNVIIRWRLTK